MPTKFNFAFSVKKDWDNPTVTTDHEAFMALVRCIASQPTKVFNLKDDECVRFVDVNCIDPETKKPKTFLISWQE